MCPGAGELSFPALASVAGGILAAMGLGASIKDLKRAQNAGLTWEKDKYMRQGLTKGGLVASGAAAGAAIGSVIPGAGTVVGGLIGGGLGGAAALLGGNSISEMFKSERERAHESLLQMGDDLAAAIENYNETAAKTDIARGLIEEYQELRDYMNSSDFDDTKAEAVQGRMKQILEDLKEMFPELYSGYDTLNGLSQERIDWIDKEMDKMDEQARRHLIQEVMDTREQIPQMDQDYEEISADLKQKQEEWRNVVEFREGLREILSEYRELIDSDEGISDADQQRLTDQASQLSKRTKQGKDGEGYDFSGNPSQMLISFKESKLESQELSNAIDERLKQQAEMDAQIQMYYDSSLKLIEMDTGINLGEQQEKLESLKEIYDFMESHHGGLSDELRQMAEEILPGFSEAGTAAEKMDLLTKAFGETKFARGEESQNLCDREPGAFVAGYRTRVAGKW